jgi:anti-sigma-K factor RskA
MPKPILTDTQPHDEAETLLPWYATGQLDAADRALVERHLESCARCQRQLAVERRLIDEFQTLTPEVDSGWARLRTRLEPPRRRHARSKWPRVFSDAWRGLKRPAVAAFAAAQLAFVVIAGSLIVSLSRTPYQALSSPPPPASANIIVMFQPNSSESDLRKLMDSSGATFVGGPTDADAYLLHVPDSARPRALAQLQADPHVTLAQAIDGVQQ